MDKLEKLRQQNISQGLLAEIKDSPSWMHPYSEMLIIKKPSGFILQIVVHNPQKDIIKVIT